MNQPKIFLKTFSATLLGIVEVVVVEHLAWGDLGHTSCMENTECKYIQCTWPITLRVASFPGWFKAVETQPAIDCSCMHPVPHNSWGIGFLHALLVYFLSCTFVYLSNIVVAAFATSCRFLKKTRYTSLVMAWKRTHHRFTLHTWLPASLCSMNHQVGQISKILIFVCSGWVQNCFVFKFQWMCHKHWVLTSSVVKYTAKYLLNKRNTCACVNSGYQAVSQRLWIGLETRLLQEMLRKARQQQQQQHRKAKQHNTTRPTVIFQIKIGCLRCT